MKKVGRRQPQNHPEVCYTCYNRGYRYGYPVTFKDGKPIRGKDQFFFCCCQPGKDLERMIEQFFIRGEGEIIRAKD
jgi:hypothetical protein